MHFAEKPITQNIRPVLARSPAQRATTVSKEPRMKRLSAWLLVLSLLALGCSTAGRKQSSAGPDPTPDPVLEIASGETNDTLDVDGGMVDRLDEAVDSTAALYGFGDIADFVSARDSLRRSVDALAMSYPAIRSDSIS